MEASTQWSSLFFSPPSVTSTSRLAIYRSMGGVIIDNLRPASSIGDLICHYARVGAAVSVEVPQTLISTRAYPGQLFVARVYRQINLIMRKEPLEIS